MKAFIILGGLGVLFGIVQTSGGAGPGQSAPQVDRYQLVVADGVVFMVDSASGQCWSRVRHGVWVDEGNPTILPGTKAKTSAERETASLQLPQPVVELTVKQRRSRSVPGSDGTLWVEIDDITAQQVMVSVRTRNRKKLLDDVSLKEGEVRAFEIDRRRYFLRLKELTNVLFGDDFAVIDIAANADDFPRLDVGSADDTAKAGTAEESTANEDRQ